MQENSVQSAGRLTADFEQLDSEDVLDLLLAEACLEGHAQAAGQNALFARLYYYTTRNWLKRAGSCDDPELLHLMVGYFYALYCQYVLEVDRRKTETTVAHWKPYRTFVRRRVPALGHLPQLLALVAGIRAHTRFDLAEAICLAHDRYSKQHGSAPDKQHFHALLFGKASDEVFRDASVEFVRSLFGSTRLKAVLTNILKPASKLWLPVFQGARKMAWDEAERSISTGRPISRSRCLAFSGQAF